MPEGTYNKVLRKWEPGSAGVVVKGSEAGQDTKYDEKAEQAAWDSFKKEKKLSFAASKPKYADEFASWRKLQGKNKGQMEALSKEE